MQTPCLYLATGLVLFVSTIVGSAGAFALRVATAASAVGAGPDIRGGAVGMRAQSVRSGACKVLHIVRHGQAQHNVRAEVSIFRCPLRAFAGFCSLYRCSPVFLRLL